MSIEAFADANNAADDFCDEGVEAFLLPDIW